MMGRELMHIAIYVDEINEVKGYKGIARMILFHGEAESEFFTGTVCRGGVDTQKQQDGGFTTLSARYILEGHDNKGRHCKIFVENNGVDKNDGQPFDTTPVMLTDNEELKWLEELPMAGKVCFENGQLIIRIYEAEK